MRLVVAARSRRRKEDLEVSAPSSLLDDEFCLVAACTLSLDESDDERLMSKECSTSNLLHRVVQAERLPGPSGKSEGAALADGEVVGGQGDPRAVGVMVQKAAGETQTHGGREGRGGG